jgi:hypothetical protein
MFALPEILFFITPLSILSFFNNFSETNIKSPIYYVIGQQFFTDHIGYLFLAMGIEWLGILGLLIMSIKFKKKILITGLLIFLLWFSAIFGITNMLSHMELVM